MAKFDVEARGNAEPETYTKLIYGVYQSRQVQKIGRCGEVLEMLTVLGRSHDSLQYLAIRVRGSKLV